MDERAISEDSNGISRSLVATDIGIFMKSFNTFRWTLFLAVFGLFSFASVACKKDVITSQVSAPTGLFQPGDRLFVRPKNKSQEALNQFGDQLVIKLSRVLSSNGSTSASVKPKEIFHQAYLEALINSGGLPRAQGENILKKILDPTVQLCGGANCGVILGMTEHEIPHEFDEMLIKAGSSKTLAKSDMASTRQLVLGSLLYDGDEAKKGSWALIRQKHLERPKPMPPKPAAPKDRLDSLEIKRAAGFAFIEAINSYTSQEFRIFRAIELYSDDELVTKGLSREEIKSWRQTIILMNDGLKKLPKFSGQIYRGVSGIKDTTLASWIEAWRDKKTFVLGTNNKPALASCTWNPEIAENYLFRNRPNQERDEFSVLFQISNHRGVSIEHVSQFPGEKEVLLPSDQKFMIESIAPLENAPRTLVIQLRGVDVSARGSTNVLKKAG